MGVVGCTHLLSVVNHAQPLMCGDALRLCAGILLATTCTPATNRHPLLALHERRVLIDAEWPAPSGVSFRVLPPMPRLEVSVSGLPPTVLAGEVVRCTMRLRNNGAMSLHRLSMAAAAGAGVFLQPPSSPPSGSPSSHAASAHPAAAGSSPGGGGSGPAQLVSSFRQGAAVFSLPAARLGLGQELELPVWFRSARCCARAPSLRWHAVAVLCDVRADALRC